MKIEETLNFTQVQTKPSGSSPGEVRLVKSYDISALSQKLMEKDVKLHLDRSSRIIGYNNSELKIPLHKNFDKSLVIGYEIKGKNLEIELRDCHDSSSSGGKRVIGAPVTYIDGVTCTIKFEGSYEEGAIVDTIEKVLRNYHHNMEL